MLKVYVLLCEDYEIYWLTFNLFFFYSNLEGTCNRLVMYGHNSILYKSSIDPVLMAISNNLQSTKIQLQMQLGLMLYITYWQVWCYISPTDS
jgi:hypothetical protein